MRIQLAGVDPLGAPLDVRDAEGLSRWLLKGGVRGLLTAGPAAGKTWLLSQVIIQAIARSGTLVPILIEMQRLQKALAANEAAFAAAPDTL